MSKRAHRGESGQVGLIAMVVVLLILGVLGAVAFGAFSGSGGGSGGPNGQALTGTADDIIAKQSLTQAQNFAQSAAAAGYQAVTPGSLEAAGPGLTYTAGPSTSDQQVSVASTADSATLAASSGAGTCWYVWLGSGGPLYGALTGQQSCQAPQLGSTPVAGPASATAIGWAPLAFPST